MTSFVALNRKSLEKKHYVRRAGARDYWFDFSKRKLDSYNAMSTGQFCLILFGSDLHDDAYIIPFRRVRHLLVDEHLDERGRWVGRIIDNVFYINRSGAGIDVSVLYNNVDVLDE